MTTLAQKLGQIATLVGESQLITDTDAVVNYRVDGQQPVGVVFPGTPEEVAAVLRSAGEAGFSVLLRGAGRHMYLGDVPGPIGLVVSLSRLDRIVEYDAENLTITAGVGTTLDALQGAIGGSGAFVPLDPPGGGGATIGGISAGNFAGALRMSYGAPRDLIIGMTVALADGTLIKTGGKTVKNVAGYELIKLFVGSFGTVGAICQVTLRLSPEPEKRALLAAALPPERAGRLAREVIGSNLEVATVDIVNEAGLRRMRLSLPLTIEHGMSVIFIGLMGDILSTTRQIQEVRGLLEGGCAQLEGVEAEAVWSRLRDLPFPELGGGVIGRAGTTISSALDLVELLASSPNWWTLVRTGDGLAYVGIEKEETKTVEHLAELRQAAENAGGYFVLEAGSPNLKRSFPVWGECRDVDLMKRLKDTYDPSGTLGCGRIRPGT